MPEARVITAQCLACRRPGVYSSEQVAGYERCVCSVCTLEWWVPAGQTVKPMEYETDPMYAYQGRRALAWYHRQFINASWPTGPLLDVGFGQGEFLAAVLSRGFAARGIDVSARNVAIAQEKYGVVATEVASIDAYAQKMPGTFQYVTAFEVIEHVSRPQGFLDSARALLKPGGLLVLSTPNKDRFGGTRERWDYPPNHLSRFNERSLRTLLEACGFEVLRMKRERFTNDFFHIRGTLSLGIAQKMRGGGQAPAHPRLFALVRALARVKRFIFDLITVPISLLLAALGVRYWDLYVVARMK